MGQSRVTFEERRLIDDAVAAGLVTVCPTAGGPRPGARMPKGWDRPSNEDRSPRLAGPMPREVRKMGVKTALEWAFGVEHARLSYGDVAGRGLPPFGMEFLLMERAMLGQQVDVSAGRSQPADDAELIAAAVQGSLSQPAALRLVDHARAASMPWSGDMTPRMEPCDWVCGRGGKWRGRTEDARHLGAEGWQPVARINRIGRKVVEPVRYTPVRWAVTAQQIARKRREHLDWWGDLLTVRTALMSLGLRWIEITPEMPPVTPWKKPS